MPTAIVSLVERGSAFLRVSLVLRNWLGGEIACG